MTEKEKEVQRALGLEKGFITRLSVEIPVWVSVPIIAKGFSEKEVRDRLWELPDNVKKQIIQHICRTVMGNDVFLDKDMFGEMAIDEISTMTRRHRYDMNPEDLSCDCIEIETDIGIDTIADAVKYLKDEWDLTGKDEILII